MSAMHAESVIPADWEQHPDAVLSNFDTSTIDHDVAGWLQEAAGRYAQHAGWDFCGYVWWDADARQWVEEVGRHNAPVKVVRAAELDALRAEVNDEFGWH